MSTFICIPNAFTVETVVFVHVYCQQNAKWYGGFQKRRVEY
jgi:hypothetical protein